MWANAQRKCAPKTELETGFKRKDKVTHWITYKPYMPWQQVTL